MSPRRRIGYPLPGHYRKQYERHADERSFQHAAGAHETQVDAKQQCDGNRCSQREGGPRRTFQSVDNYQGYDAEQNNHDGKDGELRDEAAALAHFFASHFAEGFPVAADGTKQNHEILHASCKRGASDQPKRSG